MKNNKLKVAIVCGFSDPKLRENLLLKDKRPIFHFLIRLFHLPARVGKYSDHAPWITNMIEEFEKRNDLEIHIIASHISMVKTIQEFEVNGVFYHIYCSEFSSFMRATKSFKLWKTFQQNGRIVKNIVDKIKPDLVNIIGIENPTTAIPALYIHQYPIYVMCQTIYSNPERLKYSTPAQINWKLEESIINKLKYFGVYSRMHYDLLVQKNPNATIFDFQFPSKEMPKVQKLTKEYDFVNFALQLDDRKGLFDCLKALAIVKRNHPNVKLNLVGNCYNANRQKAENLINEFDIHDNVIFTPFFEKQSDMFQHLQKSRFALLPCKLDVTSGTMSQAMYYELPLIVYRTTGTPKFNLEKECALIADLNDIGDLASKMNILLEDEARCEKLKNNAKEYITNKESNAMIMDRIIADYHAIVNNYQADTPVPDNLLFDTDKYIKY